MFNPFKKNNDEFDELFDHISDLSFDLHLLRESVKELREEVDFLVDALDD